VLLHDSDVRAVGHAEPACHDEDYLLPGYKSRSDDAGRILSGELDPCKIRGSRPVDRSYRWEN